VDDGVITLRMRDNHTWHPSGENLC
jgi:hypothetical protein